MCACTYRQRLSISIITRIRAEDQLAHSRSTEAAVPRTHGQRLVRRLFAVVVEVEAALGPFVGGCHLEKRGVSKWSFQEGRGHGGLTNLETAATVTFGVGVGDEVACVVVE